MRLGDIERVVVVGLGRHGEAAADALIDEGVEVVISDEADTPALRSRAVRFQEMGADVQLGAHDLGLVGWADLVVPCPGVAPSNPILAEALRRGVKVWSEVELGWRLFDGTMVGITGTNGKTTTTALVTEILAEGGLQAATAGNNWVPLSEVARSSPAGSLIVCELSSFQLAFIDRFRPDVAIVLNVADDHYDWHSGYDSYVAAKARITENQTDRDLLVFKSSDAGCVRIASSSRARLGAFDLASIQSVVAGCESNVGRSPSMAGGIEDGRIFVDSEGVRAPLTRTEDIRLPGRHNLDNVLAAALVAIELGVDGYSAANQIQRFEGLAHRTKLVAEIAGVTYIDDSKATNPHATLRALEGRERVILIAGGRAKGVDLTPLGAAKQRLTGAVVMGEAAAQLEAVLSGVRLSRAADIEEAVRIAAQMASSGDTVILSPACSSLDQYESYAQRGDRFVKAVAAL